jgi:hypothetical protein
VIGQNTRHIGALSDGPDGKRSMAVVLVGSTWISMSDRGEGLRYQQQHDMSAVETAFHKTLIVSSKDVQQLKEQQLTDYVGLHADV